jgi:hypothetical protein
VYSLYRVLQEVNTVEKIVHYENSDFEKNKVGVENAEQELGKIFESSNVKILEKKIF